MALRYEDASARPPLALVQNPHQEPAALDMGASPVVHRGGKPTMTPDPRLVMWELKRRGPRSEFLSWIAELSRTWKQPATLEHDNKLQKPRKRRVAGKKTMPL